MWEELEEVVGRKEIEIMRDAIRGFIITALISYYDRAINNKI